MKPNHPIATPFRFSAVGIAAIAFAVALVVPRQGHAQVSPEDAARFQLADTYIRAGQFDRAIALLEDLYAENGEYAFFAKLVNAYENTKQYDKAIDLIDERIERDPSAVPLIAERARLLYLDQQTDAASETWQRAIAAAPGREMTYRLVYQSVAEVREFEDAIAILLQGRTALRDSSLFRQELGYLYGMTSAHGKAMDEYLSLVRTDERQLVNVKSRLGRFADQPGVVAASVEVVERGVRAEPLNRAFRELLGWLYLESGMFRPALDAFRAIDRLESEFGRVLFTFAGQASTAGAFDVALEAYTEILETHGDRPIASEALRGKAEMHRRWAETLEASASSESDDRSVREHYALSLDALEEYAELYPTSPNLPYVLLDTAELHQAVFFDLEPAREILENLIRRFPIHAAADGAAHQLGRLLVMEGNLDEARLRFARLEERLRTGDLAEQARYEIAQIHFYKGEFDAAEAIVGALKENTSNDTANDAISMRVLLLEGRGPDSSSSALRSFADARLLIRQRRFMAAYDALEGLRKTHPGHALTDDAIFEQANILVTMDRVADAYQLFAELPLRHPDSHLADRSLFQAANLQELQLGDIDKAIELYNRLMREYPGSLLARDARLRIRALRGDSV